MKKLLSNSFLVIIVLVVGFVVGKKIYMTPNYSDGEVAPNFSGTLPNGQNFELTDLKGSYVLIDFWGSWCFPCKAESPAIIDLHNQFNGKKFKDAEGFEIVGVAIEKDEARWKRAIQKWNLPWQYQVVDLNTNFKFFDSQIASDYGVKEVPTKFLVSPDGQIIGVNQKPEEIAAFLSENLMN